MVKEAAMLRSGMAWRTANNSTRGRVKRSFNSKDHNGIMQINFRVDLSTMDQVLLRFNEGAMVDVCLRMGLLGINKICHLGVFKRFLGMVLVVQIRIDSANVEEVVVSEVEGITVEVVAVDLICMGGVLGVDNTMLCRRHQLQHPLMLPSRCRQLLWRH